MGILDAAKKVTVADIKKKANTFKVPESRKQSSTEKAPVKTVLEKVNPEIKSGVLPVENGNGTKNISSPSISVSRNATSGGSYSAGGREFGTGISEATEKEYKEADKAYKKALGGGQAAEEMNDVISLYLENGTRANTGNKKRDKVINNLIDLHIKKDNAGVKYAVEKQNQDDVNNRYLQDQYGIDIKTFGINNADIKNWAEKNNFTYYPPTGVAYDIGKLVPNRSGNKPTGQQKDDAKKLLVIANQNQISEQIKNSKAAAVLYNVENTISSPVRAAKGGLFTAKSTIGKAFGKDIDIYDESAQPQHISDAIKGATQENYASKWFGGAKIPGLGNVGNFVYGAGTSTLENVTNILFSTAVTKGLGITGEAANKAISNMTSTIMSSDVAANTIINAVKNGESDGKALLKGYVAGFAEWLTEKYSIEQILKGGTSWWRSAQKSFLAESSEELASNWINRIADGIINPSTNDLTMQYYTYLSQGDTPREALEQVTLNMLSEDFQSALAGGISGIAMGGAFRGVNAIQTAQLGGQIVNEGGAIGTMDEGLRFGTDTDAYKNAEKLVQKMNAGKNVSNYSIGKQAVLNSEQTVETIKRNVANDLKLYGETNTEGLAEAMTSLLTGEKISGKQAELIAKSNAAVSLLEIYTGEDINTDRSISEVKKAVKNLDTSVVLPSLFEISSKDRISDFAKTLGDSGKNILTKFYNGEQNAEDFVREMNAVYNAGKNNTAMPLTNTVTSAQAQAMYQAGQVDSQDQKGYNINKKGAVKNENTRGQDNRQGSQRNDSGNTERQVSEVESGTGRNAENRSNEVRPESSRQTKSEVQRNQVKGKTVTAESLGIKGGDSRNRVTLVTEYEGKGEVERIARSQGLKVIAFEGDYLSFTEGMDEFHSRGALQGDTMYIRADDPDVKPLKIAKHEATHDKIKKGQINLARVKERSLDISGGEIKKLTRVYANAFYGIEANEEISEELSDYIFEEIVCDSVAGMNFYEYNWGNYDEATGMLNQMISDYAWQNEREIAKSKETRGSPTGTETKFSSKANTFSTKGKYNSTGIKLSQDEYAKFFSSVSTDYYNKNKTHEGLQYQSCVFDDRHILYIYEDGGFAHYKPVAKFDFANERLTQAVVEVIRNGRIDRISDIVNRIVESNEIRRGGYSIYNTRTRRRKSANGDVAVYQGQLQDNNTGRTNRNGGNISKDSGGTKFSLVSPKTNAEYLSAVENGDTKKAQAMVDDAAKKAMPNTAVVDKNGNPLRVYHGTESDFWTFDILKSEKNGRALGYGFYFAKRKSFAEHYGNRIVEAYIDIQKPLSDSQKVITLAETKKLINAIIDRELTEYKQDGLIWQDIFISNYVDTYSTSRNNAVQEVANIIYNANDNDSDVVYEIANASGYNYSPEAIKGFYEVLTSSIGYDGYIRTEGVTDESDSVYVVFSPEQIKSADAVTYDDDGNVIPLSERFNPNKDDIRYSRTAQTHEEIKAENKALREEISNLKAKVKAKTEQAEYWKGETQTTKDAPTANQNDIKEVVSQYFKDYGVKLDRKDVQARVTAISEYIMRGEEDTGVPEWDTLKRMAYNLADEMIRSCEEIDTDKEEQYKRIKDYFKNTTIKVSNKGDIADYNSFRKSLFGKINLSLESGTPIESLWDELGDMFGKNLFPDEIINPTDQLYHAADVLYDLSDIYHNPFEEFMEEAKQDLSNDIIEKCLDGTVRQKRTVADKQYKRYNERTIRLKSTLAQVRERRDAQLAEVKESYKTYRENVRDRQLTAQLLKIGRRMANKKLPAPNQAVKAEWDRIINQFIGDFDFSVAKVTPERQAKMSEIASKIAQLQDEYPEYQIDANIQKEISKMGSKHVSDLTTSEKLYLIDALVQLEHEIDNSNRFLTANEKRSVKSAGLQVIRDIQNADGGHENAILSMLSYGILRPDSFIKKIVGYNQDSPLYKAFRNLQEGEKTMIDYGMKAADMFRRFEGKDKAYPQYNGFKDKISGKKAEHISITGTLYTATDEDGKPTGGKVKLDITPAMRMSIFMHSLNPQNLAHMVEGGVEVPNINSDAYKKGDIYNAPTERVVLSLAEIRRINASMTKEERAFCYAMQRYFSEMSQPSINEVSLKLFGVEKATVENYFPISVVGSFRYEELGAVRADGTVVGMSGRLNERVDSKLPIWLLDANDVLKQNILLHSRFVGLAIPYRDMNKLWNVQETGVKDAAIPSAVNENKKSIAYITNIKETVKNKWTNEAVKYMDNLVGAFNKGSDKSGWDALFSRYQKARLALNLGVALKQAASFPTAIAEVGWKPVLKALFSSPNKNLLQRSARYRYRTGAMDIIQKEGMDVIQWVDTFTVAHLLPAAEFYVQENNKDLKIGSEEYNKKVLEVFDDIITKTQPNYTPLERPGFLRSKNIATRAINIFKTQPYQNFNILYDAFGEYNAAKKAYKFQKNAKDIDKDALKEVTSRYDNAKTKLAWGITSQIASSFIYAAMQAAVDFMRSAKRPKLKKKYLDKDGKFSILTLLKGIGINMFTNVGGMMPLGSEFINDLEDLTDKIRQRLDKEPIFDAYSNELNIPAFTIINDLFKNKDEALSQTVDLAFDVAEGEKPQWDKIGKAFYGTLVSAVELSSGTPIKNVTNLADTIISWFRPNEEQDILSETMKEMRDDNTYKALDNAEKKEVRSAIEQYAKKTAKSYDKEPDSWMIEAKEIAQKTNLPVSTYIVMKNEISKIKGITGKNGKSIANSKSLLVMDYINSVIPARKQEQRMMLYEAFDVGGKVIHFNERAVKETLAKMRRSVK